MKIINYGEKNTREINLRLKSTDRKLQWFINPGYGLVPDDRDGQAYIAFDDSYEVDQLINILQKFKEDNQQYFGMWR